jgi:Fe2+ or Zn2+ uptake regulation protein
MMERQMRLVEDELLLPPIQVHMDKVDKAILSIFRKHPDRKWKVNQISSILVHEGINAGYTTIARHLDVMCTLTILSKERSTGKVYRYYLSAD